MRRSPLTVAGVYGIVDLPYPFAVSPAEVASALVAGGVNLIQLRAKHASSSERRAWAEAIAEPCRGAGVPLIINDDLELAEAGVPGVAGLHLGQDDLVSLGVDLPTRRRRRERLRERGLALGVSTHDIQQVGNTVRELDPDYLGFGPVFATASKANPDPVVGLEGLRRACGESPVPIVAIGGIDLMRAPVVAKAGTAAIAAIGALTDETGEAIRGRAVALVRAFEG